MIGCEVDIESRVECLDRMGTLRRCNEEHSSAPALAMYMDGKPVKICPSAIQEQQTMWASIVERAVRICIVGARVHQPDLHIWGPLARTQAQIFYFGRAEDESGFKEWAASASKKNAYFHKMDFLDAIQTIANKCSEN
jgi:hypothetical protein